MQEILSENPRDRGCGGVVVLTVSAHLFRTWLWGPPGGRPACCQAGRKTAGHTGQAASAQGHKIHPPPSELQSSGKERPSPVGEAGRALRGSAAEA